MEVVSMSAMKKRNNKITGSLRPLADRVVVQPLETTEDMKRGLYIPDTAKEKPQQGEIVAVGPGGIEKGERVPMELEVGQIVLYGKYSGTEVTINDNKLLIIKESDVLAVIG
jgi:chaperonin GroES